MPALVTVFGASGFVGRYVVRRLAQEGYRVRAVTRRPEEAGFLRVYGHPGQVEPILGNIRDDASVAMAVRGAAGVVNCVGTFDLKGRNRMEAVQADGAVRVARAAAAAGVQRMVHVSAIGADPGSPALYGRTKAAGEAGVLAAFPAAVILRPSVIFGTEDQFLNRFATMATQAPVLPLFGAEAKFQPVWVDDVAAAVVAGLESGAPGVYELGGPEVMTFREIMGRMLHHIRRARPVIGLPFGLGRLIATVTGGLRAVTGGLAPQPVTRDQLASLTRDTVVSPGARGFADLGLTPAALDAVAPDYLWRFRPAGQYAAIRDSARNLRT